MVSSTRQAITCFLLIFCSALYAYSQTNPGAKGPTATVSGKVTIKGKGASGILVGLRTVNSDSSGRQKAYKAVTDDQGSYKISNVPPGHYLVRAASPVFVSEDQLRPKTILISKDETIENVDIALLRGGVITGKVTDPEGRPLIEEQVSIHPVQMSGDYYPLVGVNTDDRGIYRIYGLAPGKYHVAAGANRNFFGVRERALYRLTYHPATTDISQATIIDVSEGSEAINIDIVAAGRPPARYSAHGRIVDGTTGQPLPNVSYGIQYFEGESGGSMTSGAVSNPEGEFKFTRLAPGKYAVFIVPSPDSDWRADNVAFEVTDHDVTGLIVKTSKGASVSGVLVLEGTDDKSARVNLRQVALHAYTLGDWQSSGEPPVVQPDGSFRVRALKAGMLAFSLSNHGKFEIARIERDGIPYPKGIPIKNGEQVTGVRVVLNYGSGTVRGVVKVEGDPLPQNAVTQVSLKRLGEDQYFLKSWANSALVDARGQFSIENVLPGTYEVSAGVYVPGAQSVLGVTKQQVAVSDGGTTNVTLTVRLKPPPDRP